MKKLLKNIFIRILRYVEKLNKFFRKTLLVSVLFGLISTLISIEVWRIRYLPFVTDKSFQKYFSSEIPFSISEIVLVIVIYYFTTITLIYLPSRKNRKYSSIIPIFMFFSILFTFVGMKLSIQQRAITWKLTVPMLISYIFLLELFISAISSAIVWIQKTKDESTKIDKMNFIWVILFALIGWIIQK